MGALLDTPERPPSLLGLWRIPPSHLTLDRAIPALYQRPPILAFHLTSEHTLLLPFVPPYLDEPDPPNTGRNHTQRRDSSPRKPISHGREGSKSEKGQGSRPNTNTNTNTSAITNTQATPISRVFSVDQQAAPVPSPSSSFAFVQTIPIAMGRAPLPSSSSLSLSSSLILQPLPAVSPDAPITVCAYRWHWCVGATYSRWQIHALLPGIGWSLLVDVRHRAVCEFFHNGILWVYERMDQAQINALPSSSITGSADALQVSAAGVGSMGLVGSVSVGPVSAAAAASSMSVAGNLEARLYHASLVWQEEQEMHAHEMQERQRLKQRQICTLGGCME